MKGDDHTEKGPAGPSDEELMARFQRGDADAMTEIIDRHGQRLFAYLVRVTRTREKAEDAYQEVFLRVIRSASSYKSSSRFAAWLFTIARNITIDQARRDRHRAAESLDAPAYQDSDQARIETVADPGPDPEVDLMAAETRQALEDAIRLLPSEQREVLLLRERAGLSFKEIAAITGAPVNTVKTRMHYAINHLRKNLKQSGFMGEQEK